VANDDPTFGFVVIDHPRGGLAIKEGEIEWHHAKIDRVPFLGQGKTEGRIGFGFDFATRIKDIAQYFGFFRNEGIEPLRGAHHHPIVREQRGIPHKFSSSKILG
jgi:hypothetical protein